MAVLNQHEKWLFLCEPHTASRATSAALLEIPGSQEIGHHHASLWELTAPHRQKTTALERFLGFDIICTIRNPFDILVTSWIVSTNSRREPISFKDWVRSEMHSETMRVPCHRLLWSTCNIVCYYEHLQEDLDYIFKRKVDLGFNQQHKTKRKKHWSEYYDKDLLNLVLLNYQSFLDNYGYQFNETRTEMYPLTEVRDRRVRRVGYGRYTS